MSSLRRGYRHGSTAPPPARRWLLRPREEREQGVGDDTGLLAGQEVTSWNDAALRSGGKQSEVARRAMRKAHGIVGSMKDDARHRDRRPLGEPALDGVVPRLARGVAVAMAIRVDHHVDEVRVVEGRCGA